MPHSSLVSHGRMRVPPATPVSLVRAASGTCGVGLLPVGPPRARSSSLPKTPNRSTGASHSPFLAAASTLLSSNQPNASHLFDHGSDAFSGYQCASIRTVSNAGSSRFSTITVDADAAGEPTRLAADMWPNLWTRNSSSSRGTSSPQRSVAATSCSYENDERLGGFVARASPGCCLERLDQMEEGMHRIQEEIEQLEWQFEQHSPGQCGVPRMELASVGNRFLRIGRPELTHPNLAFRQARQRAVEGLAVAAASQQTKSPTRPGIKTRHPPPAHRVHGAGLIANHRSSAQRRCTRRTLPEVVGASLGLQGRSKDE